MKEKLLAVALVSNAVLLILLITVVIINYRPAAETAAPVSTESESVATTPTAPSTEATTATDVFAVEPVEPSESAAPGATTPDCFGHFYDTHPSVQSGRWTYLTIGEEKPLLGSPESVVVIVDDYEVVGAVRFEYRHIVSTLNIFDGLTSDCDPIEATIEEIEDGPPDGRLYLAVDIDGTEYRMFLFPHENQRIETARLEKP